MSAEPDWAYHAFISYSHARDLPIAEAFQRELRRFGVPWFRHRTADLTDRPGPPHRPLRIFRDATSLSASPELWPTIETALRASRWFILIASPPSAESIWVRKEIDWWLANRGRDTILIALTGGRLAWSGGDFDWTITDALPREQLEGVFAHEPRWIDLRSLRPDAVPTAGSDARLPSAAPRPPRLRLGDVVGDFAAPIRGVPKDAIVGEHIRQRTRARWTIRGAVAVLSAALVATTAAAVIATRQRANAIEQRNTAVANQLVAEAQAVQDSQPGLARQLLAAAYQIKLTPQVAGALAAGPTVAQELHIAADRFTFRADSKVLAVVRGGSDGRDGLLRLYDTRTLAVLAEKELDRTAVNAAVFGPAPGHLLAVTAGTDVLLWDVRDPRAPAKVGRLVGHQKPVLAVAFSPDGKLLVTASRDGDIQTWNIADPALPAPLGALPFRLDFARYKLEFQPDGHTVAMAPILALGVDAGVPDHVALLGSGKPTPLVMFDVTNPRRVTPSLAPGDPVYTFAFAPDGARLVTANKGAVRLWRTAKDGTISAPQPLPLADPATRVYSVAYGPGGRVATVDQNGTLSLLDVSGAAPIVAAQLSAPADRLPSNLREWERMNVWDRQRARAPDQDRSGLEDLGFSPDGSQLAMLTSDSNAGAEGAGAGGTLWIWNVLDTRQRSARAVLPGRLVISPDGRRLATIDGETIRLWDATDPLAPRQLGSITGKEEADDLAFSPSGRTLAAYAGPHVWAMDVGGGQPREVGRWRTVDGQNLCPDVAQGLTCEIDVTAVTFLDESTIAAGDVTGQVSLFAVGADGGSSRQPAVVPVGTGYSVDLAPIAAGDRRLLVIAGLGGINEIWDMSDPARPVKRAEVPGGTYQIQDLAVSRDERTLAIVHRDGTAWVWRVVNNGQSLHLVATLTDTGDLNAAALTPDGGRLAVLGRDHTLRTYRITADAATPDLIMPVERDASPEMTFVGDALALATEYGKTTIWQLDPAANARSLCVGAGPPMSPQQWARAAPGLPFRPPCR